jgi:hypothetical protein
MAQVIQGFPSKLEARFDPYYCLSPPKNPTAVTLTAVKLWAKHLVQYVWFPQRCFWAMLVARTCQPWPNAKPSTIFFIFFVVGPGLEFRTLLAKQVLYCLNHTSSPFHSGYFGDRVL